MSAIRYIGVGDLRELDAADLKKAGVEGFKKTTFAKGEVTEVDDQVAEALVGNESGLFHDEFEAVKDDEELDSDDEDEDDDTPASGKATKKAAGSKMTASGSTQQSTDSDSTTASKTAASKTAASGNSTP